MKLIPPIEVTSSILQDSNVAITETEWTAGTYTTGTKRYVGTDLYEVVATPNTSDEPVAGSEADPPTWINIGKINRFKMFDFVIGEATTQTADSIDVKVEFSQLVNSVAIFEVVGNTIQVIMTDDLEGVVYDTTKTLDDFTGISNWFQYFFAPYAKRTSALFDDLPAYIGAEIRVIVDADGGDTAVGEMIFGSVQQLGVTLTNFGHGIEDFSRKERDDFGNFVVVERRFARLANYDVFLPNNQVNSTFETLAKVRATPAVYIGGDDYPETIVLGFFKDFAILRTGPQSSEMTLEIEGLV